MWVVKGGSQKYFGTIKKVLLNEFLMSSMRKMAHLYKEIAVKEGNLFIKRRITFRRRNEDN